MSDQFVELSQRLRDHGLRLTPQRLLILQAVLGRKDHPTVEDVFRQTRDLMPTVSLTTVYHTLETLVQVGAIAKVSSYSDLRRYDGKVDQHVHVICSSCGQIVDAPLLCAGEELPDLEQTTGYAGLRPVHTFAGICPTCQASQTSPVASEGS